MVWLYALSGFHKLIWLMHRGANYHFILPQDGVYTAAFSALAGKLAGRRVVCIDHGNLGLLRSSLYRDERRKGLAAKHWFRRFLSRFLYLWYWPSLYLLAKIAALLVDHYLIPGVEGDGVEEICRDLGVPISRITRFANMIDINRHVIPDTSTKAYIRETVGISSDTLVITMICRLAPEKGLDIAIEAIDQALSALPIFTRKRVRVIIAGDGPMRKIIEAEIYKRGLSEAFVFFGEASKSDVISILGITDIFLYTSRRGAGYPLAILEAMASNCVVIASSEPFANSRMLAENRGIVVSVGNIEQTSLALIRLLNDPALCCQMGESARAYVKLYHSPDMLRRTFMRVITPSAINELFSDDHRKDS
jgi:glycosyltransferase involved in cell wall biosynthesis